MRGRAVLFGAAWAAAVVGASAPAAAAAWAPGRPRMDPACCARPGSSVFGLPWVLYAGEPLLPACLPSLFPDKERWAAKSLRGNIFLQI
jgi:hypothetical protein